MNTKNRPNSAPLDIYIFNDFAAGTRNQDHSIVDWQTAIELAGTGWKLTHHPHVYINDGAAPLDPAQAGAQLAATFPYSKGERSNAIKRLVVHVIDPGVGNLSQHPRTLVLRHDGILFIGPDNGTLSGACPPGSIRTIWEINTKCLSELTGIDLAAGGTFHGRDLFAAAAFLLAADKVRPEEIGIAYSTPELKFRFESCFASLPVQFQKLSTSQWSLKLEKNASSETQFGQAFLLGIVQSPFYIGERAPQLLFMADKEREGHIAIYNRKTGNLYVGLNNGLGTSFFHSFPPQEVLVVELDELVYHKVKECQNVQNAVDLILKQPPLREPLVAINLLAREIESPHSEKRMIQGHIWVDAYGNLKTTLASDLFHQLLREGYRELTVKLNGVTRSVLFANSFADVPPGEAFVYVGSSGAIGPNSTRSRRYIEISCNGRQGIFGADLFHKGKERPCSGQEITFHFTKHA